MTAREYAAVVEAVIRYRKTDEHHRRAWLLARKLEEEGW